MLNSPSNSSADCGSEIGFEGALTRDAFLGGRLQLLQPELGYRAGIDAVLLAASVPARAGESVLELGCGAGVATLCLMERVADLRVTGLEVQECYAALARRNATESGLDLTVLHGDLSAMPTELKQQRFDHVLANPPYFTRIHGTETKDASRDRAMREETDLGDWMDAAARRLLPGGTFSLIQRSERLLNVIQALDSRFGAVQILPVASRQGRPAKLFLLRALKGRRSPPQLLSPMILHEGPVHEKDGDSFTLDAAGVFRDGDALADFDS